MKHVIVTRRSCVYAEVGGGVIVTLGSRCREVWIDKQLSSACSYACFHGSTCYKAAKIVIARGSPQNMFDVDLLFSRGKLHWLSTGAHHLSNISAWYPLQRENRWRRLSSISDKQVNIETTWYSFDWTLRSTLESSSKFRAGVSLRPRGKYRQT